MPYKNKEFLSKKSHCIHMKLNDLHILTLHPLREAGINGKAFSLPVLPRVLWYRQALLIFLVLLIPLLSQASELIYTIQTASFAHEGDALKYYESAGQKLDETERGYFRVEKVGKYYAIRLGRFESYKEAKNIYQTVKPKLPAARIMEAYIKDERLIIMHEGSKSGEALYPEALKMAKELIREGKNREAIELLAPYKTDPVNYPEAVSDMIVLLIWTGKPDEAMELYQGLPESFPRRAYLLRNIAKVHFDRGEYQESLALYQEALKSDQEEEAQKGVVYSLVKMGEYNRALDYANDFVMKSPDSFELSFAWADLLMKKERYPEALSAYRRLGNIHEERRSEVFKYRDDTLTSFPHEKRRAVANELAGAVESDSELFWDYVMVLVLYKEHELAVTALESKRADISTYSPELQARIAWAYFKVGDASRAQLIYQKILERDSENVQAIIGLSYCLSKEGQADEALKILDPQLSENPQNLQIKFARAYAFEQSGRLWDAVEEYDRILSIDAESPAAKRLRLMALSDIGASTHADEGGRKQFPSDSELHETFEGDMATDRILWKEFPRAIEMLRPLAQDKRNLRARFDYIVALAENYDMQEAVGQYELLVEEEIRAPEWVLENAAAAYLYLERPHKALELYEMVLEENPTSYNSRIGKFTVLQELRMWDDAWEVLNDIDKDEPNFFDNGRNLEPNWHKFDVAISRGWSLAYEDRLQESEDLFQYLHFKAPENTNVRSGLAQAYYWRGWERKAYEEFVISENLDPKDKNVQIGKVQAMNKLAMKKKARELSQKLYEKHPKDKHVKALVRELELEEMTELTADFSIGGDDDGFGEVMGRVSLTHPISLYTRLYGYLLWKTATEDQDDMKTVYRRVGAGAGHIFNRYLQFKQLFSVDYKSGEDFGSYSEIYYTPDDYWEITLSYDSFSTDLPLRARVFGIDADMINLDLAYVESDWRTYSLALSRQEFSDGNERLQALLGYEQGLWVRDNWRERIFLDFGVSSNSLDNAPYFNPDNDFSFSVTHMTEHTVKRIYREAFVYRLYLTAGGYKQDGHSLGPVGSLRYEHDIEMSDTNDLLYGVTLGSHPYDGESVTNYGFYLRWRLLF